jgi:hypothetical protein
MILNILSKVGSKNAVPSAVLQKDKVYRWAIFHGDSESRAHPIYDRSRFQSLRQLKKRWPILARSTSFPFNKDTQYVGAVRKLERIHGAGTDVGYLYFVVV